MSAVLTHAERDLAEHEREVDKAERLEAHKARYEADLHADLRAQILAAWALSNTRAPIPDYEVVGGGPGPSRHVERLVLPADAFEEAWVNDPEFRGLVLEMMADNCLPAQKARLRGARLYADRNAAGVAAARNWGLS